MLAVQTYDVHDEARLDGERSFLKVRLDFLRDEFFRAGPELDSSVVLGAKCSVVLLDAVATATPIQMQVNHCSNTQYENQHNDLNLHQILHL